MRSVLVCSSSRWLKNWGEILKPITKRSNRNRVITFDSHLKTTVTLRVLNPSSASWFLRRFVSALSPSALHSFTKVKCLCRVSKAQLDGNVVGFYQ